jgi:uncharacterized protein
MSIHVAITRKVRPGSEAAFEARLKQFARESLSQPGTTGVQLIMPTPDSHEGEYGILRSFESEADKHAFYESGFFRQWLSDISTMTEGEPVYRPLQGLEAWFYQPDMPRPPRWKLALATLCGVYPTSFTLAKVLMPKLHGLPSWTASLVMACCMVVLLTWVVMPLVTRALHRWLHP